MANGTVVTRKGLQLIAKLVASETALTFTRVAIGTGKVPGGYDPGSMTGLNEYKMDGSIASHSASGDEASVVMQISSIGVETGFTITEAGLFATDPDEGEILYAYLDMSADPQYMYPENNAISKFIELTLVVKIGEVQSVTAVINPGSLITEEKFEAEKEETVHKSDIINSFSDTAGDHETVMGTVLGYQHDRDINWLKGYAVTKEMISNQNVESTNLVPSAYLLYQLNKTLLQKCEDLLTKYNALNSDFFNKIDVTKISLLTQPSGTTIRQKIENCQKGTLCSWAHNPSELYNPTGKSGTWSFLIIKVDKEMYTICLACEGGSKLYIYSYNANAWYGMDGTVVRQFN